MKGGNDFKQQQQGARRWGEIEIVNENNKRIHGRDDEEAKECA